MDPLNTGGSNSQADSNDSLVALPCMIAVLSDISRDPRKGLTRPVGHWLPWLQEQGYSPEGFDDLLMSLLSDDATSGDYEVVNTTFREAVAMGSTTLDFLTTLNTNNHTALDACRSGLTKRLKDFSDLSSVAGGRLTGPAATWMKHNPGATAAISGAGLVMLVCGITYIACKRSKNVSKNELAENVLTTTVDDEAGPASKYAYGQINSRGINALQGLDNFERHPAGFVEANESKILELKGKLLTQDNIDKFVAIAFKDEAKEVMSTVEIDLINDFKDIVQLQRDPEIIDAEKQVDTAYKNLASELGPDQAKVFLVGEGQNQLDKLYIAYPELRDKVIEYTKLLGKFNQLKSERFTYMYKYYITNGNSESLDKALSALVKNSIEDDNKLQTFTDNAVIDVGTEIALNEQAFFRDFLIATGTAAKDAASQEATILVEQLNSFIDNTDQELIDFLANKT